MEEVDENRSVRDPRLRNRSKKNTRSYQSRTRTQREGESDVIDQAMSMRTQLPLDKEGIARQALMNLQDGYYPNHLICREEEEGIIRDFVTKGIRNKGSSSSLCTERCSLDISGVPGIGKTALVRKVVDQVVRDRRQRPLTTVNYYINALQLKKPEDLYGCMLARIFNERERSVGKALTRLSTWSNQADKLLLQGSGYGEEVRVIVLDELDFLMTKDQAVLYNLFEWTQHRKTRLVLLAIANTMNLPEKLKPRVASRIGEHRVVFRQYTAQQIQKIIKYRLEGLPIFHQSTVRFASKKIANCSSDIRKVMAVLSRSVEIALRDAEENRVTIEHVKEAFDSFFDSPVVRYISGMGGSMQICLLLIFLEIKHSPDLPEECPLTRLYERLRTTEYSCNCGQLIFKMGQLEQLKLVSLRESTVNNCSELLIKPSISVEDVKNARLRPDLEKFAEIL